MQLNLLLTTPLSLVTISFDMSSSCDVKGYFLFNGEFLEPQAKFQACVTCRQVGIRVPLCRTGYLPVRTSFVLTECYSNPGRWRLMRPDSQVRPILARSIPDVSKCKRVYKACIYMYLMHPKQVAHAMQHTLR
ncbi:hypothetical protein GGR53DRAFT_134796 [Hypoxylon sp. FL1150]|nr:hypothetical protein GGR53DRAFT_134796 [Hypoxylon sp. FL1150]